MLKEQKVLISDMDGTLYAHGNGVAKFDETHFFRDLRQATLTYLKDVCGVQADEVEAEYRRLTQQYGFVSLGIGPEFGKDRTDFFQRTWGNFNPTHYIEVDPELPVILEQFSGRLAVLTAAPKVWATSVLKLLQLENIVGDFLFTSDHNLRKPDPRAFTQILDAFGVTASLGVALGDQWLTDLKPAQELGMITVHIGSDTLNSPADYVADNIKQGIKTLVDTQII